MKPNRSQQAILDSTAPDILAIAGAGSGKTRTLVSRYLRTMGTAVIITFTNAAAGELQDRIRTANGRPPKYCGTLHGFCLSILPKCTVIDETTADTILERCIAETGGRTKAKTVRISISNPEPPRDHRAAVLRYRQTMERSGCVCYDLILWKALEHIQRHGISGIDHLFVDEYQDSAPIDAAIYAALRPFLKSCFRVGDPDQSIYSFRGAEVENILSLAREPKTTVFLMEENYRCAPEICALANSIMAAAGTGTRVAKLTRPATQEPGAIDVHGYDTDTEELEDIHNRIPAGGTVGILVRNNAERKAIESRLLGLKMITPPPAYPHDWNFACLTIAYAQDTGNALIAERWHRETHGDRAAERIIDGSRRGDIRGMAPTWLNGGIDSIMEGAKFSRATRQIMADICEANPESARNMQALAVACRAALETRKTSKDRIQVMTIHRSKGLEFDTVILPAFEERMIRNGSEDRRLAFVAITRARRLLLISWARLRRNTYTGRDEPQTPSQFLRYV